MARPLQRRRTTINTWRAHMDFNLLDQMDEPPQLYGSAPAYAGLIATAVVLALLVLA